MNFPFKSLQSRITFLFLSLILVVQFIGFIAIWVSINKNARVAITEQLDVGEEVLRAVITRRGESLTLSARILANDYGFRQAIASNDYETIASALENNSARIESDVSMLYSPGGIREVVSGKVPAGIDDSPIISLINSAQSGNNPFRLIVFNGAPYLLVAVPVKAPLTIAWIVTGFKIDAAWAKDIKDVSHLEVSFITKSNNHKHFAKPDDIHPYETNPGQWALVTSTLGDKVSNQKDEAILLQNIPQAFSQAEQQSDVRLKTTDIEIAVSNIDYSTRYMELLNEPNQTLVAVLQRSIDEALEPYFYLQLNLLGLTILGAIVFTLGSIFTARRLTKPLTELVTTAELLEKGDYSIQIQSKSHDEIGHLSRTFDRMRAAIAERENKIRRIAYWDDLTQIPNRAYFNEQLLKLATAYENSPNTFSVVMMDLNRFKNVNDVLGNTAADQLLAGVAQRLRHSCKSSSDIVARLGGDEFGIILANTDTDLALEVANRILLALETPIELNDAYVDLSAGMGIANYPQHTTNIDLLLNRAEMAMYAAKNTQKSIKVYDTSLDIANEENLSLISEIRMAVEHNQLRLFVQPKIDFATNEILSVEALVRWEHPERGLIYPDAFIPYAERTGNIGKISYWMLSEAARHTAQWIKSGSNISVAVNLSARDLIDMELPNKLESILLDHGLSADSITIEITESSIMEDPDRALETVDHLTEMGIQLAIDDFGTGYSSLAYLKRLPVSELKIDKSFVINLEINQEDITIVRSTIELGHNLGLKVVAEGIENVRCWEILKSIGCDYGQGYLISKPMPAEQFSDWMENWSHKARHEAIVNSD